jgi:hypothetical protein
VAALTFTHVQEWDGRWCIVDLVGKHQRIRTVAMAALVKVAVDAWTNAADLKNGSIFWAVNRSDCVQADPDIAWARFGADD